MRIRGKKSANHGADSDEQEAEVKLEAEEPKLKYHRAENTQPDVTTNQESDKKDEQEEIRTTLHLAAIEGDTLSIRKLVDEGHDLEARDRNHKTPLERAILHQQLQAIEALVREGARVDSDIVNPLHFAAEKGCDQSIDALVNVGLDVNEANYNDFTPLHFAAFFNLRNCAKVIRKLISHGATVDSEDDEQRTPFLAAASNGNTVAMKLLAARGANIWHVNEDGRNALHLAARGGNSDTIRYLIDTMGFEVDMVGDDGETALHLAAMKGEDDCIPTLVAKGANIDAVDDRHFTPLMVAAQFGHASTLKLLVSLGANPELRTEEGLNALHVAVRQAETPNAKETIEVLLDMGLDTEQICLPSDLLFEIEEELFSSFNTPLILAAANSNLGAVNALIENGATVLGPKVDPSVSPAEDGDVGVMRALLDNGFSINSPEDRAVHRAAANSRVDFLKYLVSEGVSINTQGIKGDTPMHWAGACGTPDTITYLVSEGAEVNALGPRGTPLFYAARNGNVDTIHSLIDHGADVELSKDSSFPPIHVAAREGKAAAVDALAIRGANLDSPTEDLSLVSWLGSTALHFAAQNLKTNVVETLLAHGASVNAHTRQGRTPLHDAAAVAPGFLSRFRRIRDDNVPYPQHDGEDSALPEASITYLIDQLEACGASHESKSEEVGTALHMAIRRGEDEAIISLASSGCGLNVADSEGYTPLMFAASSHFGRFFAANDKVEICKQLIRNGASVAAVNPEGFTVLHICVRSGKSEHFEESANLVQLFVERGANVNAANNVGVTPLHLAAAADNIPAIEMLVNLGANPKAVSFPNRVPLHWAAVHARALAVEKLIDLGGGLEEAGLPSLKSSALGAFMDANPVCSTSIKQRIVNALIDY